MPILREAFAEFPGSLCRVAFETQQNAFYESVNSAKRFLWVAF
ncbi:hypothetical protein [Leptospira noguchii]|nr:hypothetical protein [Leptospira noguchii]